LIHDFLVSNPQAKVAFVTATEDLKQQAIDDFGDYIPDLSRLTIASLTGDIE